VTMTSRSGRSAELATLVVNGTLLVQLPSCQALRDIEPEDLWTLLDDSTRHVWKLRYEFKLRQCMRCWQKSPECPTITCRHEKHELICKVAPDRNTVQSLPCLPEDAGVAELGRKGVLAIWARQYQMIPRGSEGQFV